MIQLQRVVSQSTFLQRPRSHYTMPSPDRCVQARPSVCKTGQMSIFHSPTHLIVCINIILRQRFILNDPLTSPLALGIGLSLLWAALNFCPEKHVLVIVIAWCAAAAQLLQRGVVFHVHASAQYIDGAHFHRSVTTSLWPFSQVVTRVGRHLSYHRRM